MTRLWGTDSRGKVTIRSANRVTAMGTYAQFSVMNSFVFEKAVVRGKTQFLVEQQLRIISVF